MAIDYNSGISSLQTGAPDIKYTGDQGPRSPDQQLMASADPMLVEMYQQYVFEMEEQGMQPMSFRKFMEQAMSGMAYGGTAKPTYTQSRKQRMAYGGIAGLDGRKRYGIGSWFQENVKDPIAKLIPNEIKDNPLLSSVVMGGLLDRYGIPGTGGLTESGDPFGQDWLEGLTTQVGKIPGVGGVLEPVVGGVGKAIKGAGNILLGDPTDKKSKGIVGSIPGIFAPEGDEDYGWGDLAKSALGIDALSDPQKVNWQIPLMTGLTMGEIQKRMPKANLPQDTSGIDIPAIRAAALRGEGDFLPPASATTAYAQGGRIGAQEGGLMDLGGMEKDYRQEGGFVPIGGQERADDVPARLSKNEFVFTADAVRAAGGGDIDAGAEVMENLMNNLERGGQVSEGSQGLEGARDMFATSQRLEGVM